jgi:hypothetical protein
MRPALARTRLPGAEPGIRTPVHVPATHPPSGAEPPRKSPFGFLLIWFVIPLIVLLAISYFDVAKHVLRWFGLE